MGLLDADAVQLASLVASGELTAAEAVEQAIERAEAIGPDLGAIVAATYEPARRSAAELDGTRRALPLAGVPILLKDLFLPVAGDPCYAGNRLLRDLDHRYEGTGNVGARLAGAGLVTIGRSHSPELGCGQCPAASETAAFGPTRNPWHPSRSPLGSSGGAAAAVAAGIVPLAHASDGGGSIRLPASACGVVGLKPSRGRISVAPAGELWAGGVTDGVVSRTVRDTAAALDVLAGPVPGDPYVAPPLTRPLLEEVGSEPGPLRIGVCADLPYTDVHADCREAARRAADLVVSLGHRVDDERPGPMERMDFMYDYIRVIRASLVAELRDLEAVIGRRWAEDDVEPGTWINYQRGLKISAPDYLASRERLHAFTREMLAWWDGEAGGYDVLLTPTVGTPPPPLGYLVEGDERELTRRLAEVTPFVTQFNVTGQPAVSLPLHWNAGGLPIGVQFVAAPGREDLLVRLASQLEAAAPWSHRHPPLWAG
jgi:amidase